MIIEPIAYIENYFTGKFGIPRQSGLCDMESKIIFTEKYRDENALRGIEEFSHLWLIWDFSEFHGEGFSPTVRPPKLGGNKRIGVFATRSPNRPNNLGLSLVKLKRIEKDKNGSVLVVTGADLKSGTPIYDIKPYLPSFESVPDAKGSFSDEHFSDSLKIEYDENILSLLSKEEKTALLSALACDPRPAYNDDSERIYGFGFSDFEITFKVKGDTLFVIDCRKKCADNDKFRI